MKKTKNPYVIKAENLLPKTNVFKNCVIAFLVGGAICSVGQAFSDFYSYVLNVDEEYVKLLVPVTLIFLGGLFTGIGLYDDLGKFAGAGSVVPITGFANSVVSCALEYKREGYVFGVGAKMFTIAGPVIVYGAIASVIVGIIHYVIQYVI